MTDADRERLADIMAEAAYRACLDQSSLSNSYSWEKEEAGHRELWREQQRRVIAAVERAGFRWLPPVDGR